MKRLLVSLVLFGSGAWSYAQSDSTSVHAVSAPPDHLYGWKRAIDRPISYVGVAWSAFAFTHIYSKPQSSVAQIEALNRNNIIGINRPGIDFYDPKATSASMVFFYASMPVPLLLLADKDIRHDIGRVGSLYVEVMGVTGLLYTGSVYFVDKYRPYAYNPNVPMSERTRGGAKNSFFAGHVALVGSSTLFAAKVYSDYHPHSGLNWLFYTIAGGSTVMTGYLRYRGGQHFLSDILIGGAVGTFTGLVIPQLHKKKNRQFS